MRGRRGLTTSELLVSVAALAAVMGMAFAAFRGLGSAAESSSARVRSAREMRWLFRRLDSVLPALASHTRVKFTRRCFWGEEGRCAWEVLPPRELGRSSGKPETVSLEFKRDEGLVVMTAGEKKEILARGVEDFRLGYAGPEGAFKPSWGEGGAGCARLPRFLLVSVRAGALERVHVIGLGRDD